MPDTIVDMCEATSVTSPMRRRDGAEARLRVGLVGLGLAGAGMVQAVLEHHRFTLGGAAEPNPVLRERFAQDYSCPVDSDIAELVARPGIDAVYIATPHQMHREHVTLAAAQGKHVIVEKPMALDLADCDAMIDVARHNAVALGHALINEEAGFSALVLGDSVARKGFAPWPHRVVTS